MNKLNKYQIELDGCDFVRVDGLTAKIYGSDDLQFAIPVPSDYVGMNYIAGSDFIFVFETVSDQTWYKKINVKEGEFRSNLFYIGYELNVSNLDDYEKYGVNVNRTAFSLPFKIDLEGFAIRKLKYDHEMILPENVLSCEAILIQHSGDISKKVDMFLKFIFAKSDTDLKSLPNSDFQKEFGIGVSTRKPVPINEIRNYYMLVILLTQREGRFPYNLSFDEFVSMVL